MQNTQKISVIGLVTFIIFGSCIGSLVQAASANNGISADVGYMMSFAATFIAAWYGSRVCLDEACAVAVSKLFWYTYVPVGLISWYGIVDGTLESFIRFGTVGALAGGIMLGADTKASKEAEADHLTVLLTFVAIICQFSLVQWPLSNDVPRLLAVASLALLVSLLGPLQYGRPNRAPLQKTSIT